VLPLVFRGVISSLTPPCYIGKYTMPSPYRREELIADTATLVYLLSGFIDEAILIYCNNSLVYVYTFCMSSKIKSLSVKNFQISNRFPHENKTLH
jgi:hypothetical protein